MQEIVNLPTPIMQKFEEVNSKFPETALEIVESVKNFESNLKEPSFTKRQNKVKEFATGKISFYHKQTIGFQGSWNG